MSRDISDNTLAQCKGERFNRFSPGKLLNKEKNKWAKQQKQNKNKNIQKKNIRL